jgi:hypothetical protein
LRYGADFFTRLGQRTRELCEASMEERFWSKVEIADPDNCWPWLGWKDPNGYGCVSVGHKVRKAHRVAWELTFGPIPARQRVIQSCSNPSCCNPKHLWVATAEARFWRKVDVRGPDECWEWTGSRLPFGYGQIVARYGHPSIKTHRFAYELANGPIPDGLKVLHRCDNPPCCNPAHLFLGTLLDNRRDCLAKGREARGECHPHSRLRESDVRRMRQQCKDEHQTARQLAEKYGVSKSTVSKVLSRRSWKHIGDEEQ